MEALKTNFPNVKVIAVTNEYSIGDTIDDYENYQIFN